MTEDRADREVLFEALAVHLGFLGRHALGALRAERAAQEYVPSPGRIGGISVEHSALSAEQCVLLEKIIDGLLERHGGDVRRCLDALCAFGNLRRDIELSRAGSVPGQATPTLPSIPIEHNAEALARAPGEWVDEESFDHGDLDEVALQEEAGAPRPAGWWLGIRTSAGMRFRVLRPHAQGGIGKVSVAFDSELKRNVALKQIKPERADDAESRNRFLLEAEVTGRLEHPGIVPVYGLGVDEGGRPYYAMRFVRGMSFEAAIKQFHDADADPRRDPQARSLELRHLLNRFVDICHTVAYAHSRGVLHRDLKPANVLLGPFNESLVVDWGLAKLFAHPAPAPAAAREEEPGPHGGPSEQPGGEGQRDPADQPDGARSESTDTLSEDEEGSGPDVVAPLSLSSSTETVAGTAFGTPAFMSPEQAQGRVQELGPASDVYSLGAILYTLICGKVPFEYVWCDVTALLDRVRVGEFPPPHKVKARVSRALEAVCLKAMALRPEDRYPSATMLADEISRWLADEPVLAYHEPVLARVARWGRRHKPVVASAAALLLTAVVALSVGIVLLGEEQRRTEFQRLVALQQRARANSREIDAHVKAESLRRRDAVSRVNLACREYLDDNVALADTLLLGCPSDLRSWEWAYAHRLGHGELLTFTGAKSGVDVWSVAFSPDGALLAVGSGPWFQLSEDTKAEVSVREIKTGKEVFALRGLTGAVHAVAFSHDGRQLAVARGFAGKHKGAVLSAFDTATWAPVWEIAEQGTPILSLAYSRDGRTIATGCGEFNNYTAIGFARLRGAATGSALGEPITGGPGGVLCVAFSPDGRELALSSRDVVDICDVSSQSRPLVHRLRGHVNFVYAVAFSPDGRQVATGGWDKTIRLWDRRSGALLQTQADHRGFVRGLAFSPDGSQLVSASEDKSVRRWDLTGGGDHAAFHGHTGFVHCVAFSPDGVHCASGSLDGTVKLWSAAAPDSQVTFRNGAGWVGTLAFAPDGRRVASAHNGGIRIWDPRTGEEFQRLVAPSDLLGHIALVFSPDGSTLAASVPDGSVALWDTVQWSQRSVLKSSPVANADFSPDGTHLATACTDGTIRLWDVARATPAWSVAGHAGGATAVAFAPDGRRVASGGEDRKVRVWDAASGRELVVCSGHMTGVRDVAFSPNSRGLASVGGSYRDPPPAEVKLWDSQTGRETASLHGHTSLVTSVAYFPDGKRIATASDDRTIKLWDVATGDDVFTLRGHTSGVVSVAVSRDGRQVASGSIDYTAKVWSTDVPPQQDAFELSFRRAAVERVSDLFAQHLLKDEVKAVLSDDKDLTPRFRAMALEIAERRAENPAALYEAAWLTLLSPSNPPAEHRLALRRLESACRIVAGDPERKRKYDDARALAFYRTGQPRRALATLHGLASADGQAQSAGSTSPLELAVMAMSNRQLGRIDAARTALERLRKLVQGEQWAHDQEAIGLLREAESNLASSPF